MSNLYVKPAVAGTSYDWVRPADWLPIPRIVTNEEVFYSVFAVYNVTLGNFVAFSFTGNYTVDWGDGSAIENIASGVVAQHQYDWVNVGNVTSEGFRQALIKVIPQSGQNLTTINLQKNHSTIGASKVSQHLDIVMSIPNVGGTLNFYNGTIINKICERVWIKQMGNVTSFFAMFYNAFPKLQSALFPDTSSVLDTNQMFVGCLSLRKLDLFNTQNVTDMTAMFNNCISLLEVPLFNLQSAKNISTMFNSCSSLLKVPLFNTQNVTNAYGIFTNCVLLVEAPLFNLQSATTTSYMFFGCKNLKTIPLYNLISCLNTDQMFNNCYSLVTVPELNTTNVTNTYAMFYQCPGLINLSLNLSSTTNSSLFFNTSTSLQKFTATGLKRGMSLQNCQMSATELNNFFTSLGTASGAQTIVVTGNHGASTCNTSIATAKGFTVTI